MAQFVFQDMVNKLNISSEFYIDSAATSTEELGNGPHYGTVSKLKSLHIPVLKHRARQITRSDYKDYDYIIGMDQWNYKNMLRIFGQDHEKKISLLLDYTENPRSIADPWYTGNFDETYDDICEGLEGFLIYLKNNRYIDLQI
jgi:protein-tyrosine phosphatase